MANQQRPAACPARKYRQSEYSMQNQQNDRHGTRADPAIMTEPEATNANDAQALTLLGDSVEDYCRRVLTLRRLRAARALPIDRVVWRDMAALGWTALVIPESRGGLGLGAAAVASLCRPLGRALSTEPVIETAIMAAALLAGRGAHDACLSALMTGEAIFSCPLSMAAWEQPTGIDAIAEDGGYRLSGEIENLSLAPDSDRFLLPVKYAGRVGVFCVEAGAAGVHIQPQLLADGTRAGRLMLTNVYCAADQVGVPHMDGGQAAVHVRHALALAGIGGSAYLLGLCEALLDLTLNYVRTRKQFGRPLGSFQALQHRLVDLYLQIRLTAAALNEATAACDGKTREDPLLAVSRVRQRACETALCVIREAVQMHGAIGYTEECDVALYVQRALVMVARFGGARAELNAAGALKLQSVTPEAGERPATQREIDTAPPQGDWNALDDSLFRRVVRGWITANYPPELRHLPMQIRWADIRDWHHRLLARGWAAPGWPVAHGGMGLAPNKLLIFIEELERWGVTRAPDQGIVMLGPILFEYGTAAQRAKYLEPALTGEHIWCQGYSEPNAGSDLASLATSAVLEGDEFIVNGQKTWTTHGLDATHMYCLVRTDPRAKPQAGISFLLIDLQQPGVTIRPIPNLGGHVDFCEVFLDQVSVPRANLIGELNQGWTIAKALLGHERLFVGSPKLCQHALNQLRDLAQAVGITRDPVFVDALTRFTLDVRDLEALFTEFAALVKRGEPLGPDVAILKIWSTETYVRLSEMIFSVAGAAGAAQGKLDFGGVKIDVLSHYYNARPAPIYAGGNEIQRNIIAKLILQLPT